MVNLTKQQREVLELLAVAPRYTTRTTHHGCISGATASALRRRGLARWGGSNETEITEAGRAALARER